MSLLALTAAVLLSQAEPAAEAAPEAPAEPAPAAAAAPDPLVPPIRINRAQSTEELTRQLDRIRKLPAGEMGIAMEELRKKFPKADALQQPDPHAPVHGPMSDIDQIKVNSLTSPEQVKYFARQVFNNIISGDARALVLQSGYPFQLEDRRLEMPDELHKEWLKNLRAKRTDLLTLYDVEVLTPAEMEKKYGRPPARLKGLPWQAPRTMVAVANLSGHAAIAVFREMSFGGRWQLVGYHD